MHVKNGSKDLKRYSQISRRVRDTLARLFTGVGDALECVLSSTAVQRTLRVVAGDDVLLVVAKARLGARQGVHFKVQ